MPDATELLAALVRVPSPSGEEERVVALLARWAAARGLAVETGDAGVRIDVPGREPGPLLLFASHVDTVPPGEGWSVDPYGALVADGVLWGRGAVDAKASVAAMAVAAARLAAGGGPARGSLVLLATRCEETRETTMPAALEALGRDPDHAIVGEPTGLDPAVAQRGLLVLEARWRGRQRHAARALPGENAILAAARDLPLLAGTEFPPDPVLGETKVTPTEISAGIARNATPPGCRALLDVRTTPTVPHGEVVRRLRGRLSGELAVLSDRLHPAATPAGSPLLAAIRRVRPRCRPFGSPTTSDWVFLRHVDAVKLGPGPSELSHAPDERISLAEVEDAADTYLAIAREVLG